MPRQVVLSSWPKYLQEYHLVDESHSIHDYEITHQAILTQQNHLQTYHYSHHLSTFLKIQASSIQLSSPLYYCCSYASFTTLAVQLSINFEAY